MKPLLPTFAYIGIILFAACSKEKPVTKVASPHDPIRTHTTPGPTTGPTPVTPHIDTFLGSYVDSVFNDNGGFISLNNIGNIMFTVRYTADNMVIFKSLQDLPAGGQNTAPWIYYYTFADTFVNSPTNTYVTAKNHFYTISGNNLSVDWPYEHYTYFQISRCLYTGVK